MRITQTLLIIGTIFISTSLATAAIDIDPKQYHAQRLAQEKNLKEQAPKPPAIKPVANKPVMPKEQPKTTTVSEAQANARPEIKIHDEAKAEPEAMVKDEPAVQITDETSLATETIIPEPVVDVIKTNGSVTTDEQDIN